MSRLPEGFDSLEQFVDAWALDSAPARAARRTASTEEERQAFFAALQPLVTPALERLDQTPLAEHDDAEHNLMLLCLAFAHVAQAVEVQAAAEPSHAALRESMRITRAPADA